MKWNEYVTTQQMAAIKTAAERILGGKVEVKQNYSGWLTLIPEREMD